jgi:hypothetical protein
VCEEYKTLCRVICRDEQLYGVLSGDVFEVVDSLEAFADGAFGVGED